MGPGSRIVGAMTFTHKAWFSFCPVYVSFDDEPGVPVIATRHWSLDPLFWLAEQMTQARIGLNSMLVLDYQPFFRLSRIRELKKPIVW